MRFLVLLLMAVLAAAQAPNANPQQASQQDPPKKARLEGSVISITGEPIPRATLRLQSLSLQGGTPLPTVVSATADDAGNFVFEQVEPASNYTLTAQRPGYVNARYGARSPSSSPVPLNLAEGQTVKGIVVEMTPQGVISGRVTEESGDPIQGAQVQVLRRGFQRGVRTLMPVSTTSTNDQGEYRVANLPPGSVYLSVTDRPVGLLQSAPDTGPESNVTTYYPNAIDVRSAAPLNIAPGSEVRGIDIRLRRSRVYSISGKAVNAATGAPAGGAPIVATPKQDAGASALLTLVLRGSSQSNPNDGTFTLRNLLPGAYILQTLPINLNGSPLSRLTGRLEVTIGDQNLENVVLPMSAGATITGTVRLEGGDLKQMIQAAGPANSTMPAQTALAATAAGLQVSGIRPTIGLQELGSTLGTPAAATISEDGTFTLEGVAPSTFAISVAGLPQGYYLKSANFGGLDLMRTPLDMTSGAGGTLDVVLSNNAGEISGAARNDRGDAMSGVTVTLWTDTPQPGPTNGVRTAATDQNGGFRFPALAPGEYHLAAWEEAETGLLQSREFLALFAGSAQDIEVAEGGKPVADLKVIPTADIERESAKLP